MKIVLLSGGSGKRLWPLSNDSRSKQFLQLLDDTDSNKKISMVERVWKQLKNNNLHKDVVIATGLSQVEQLKNQLGEEVTIIKEPERRDTFPAIALSATYLYSKGLCSSNEIVIVLPVDAFVEDNFFERISELKNLILDSNSKLGLIGVSPSYPSEKYGYIIPQNNGNYTEVKQFKEKPSESEAMNLIKKGAKWNCGVFGFELNFILKLLKEKGLPADYESLFLSYESLPKSSFDYEVVEKTTNIAMITYEGYWKDLGTWNTLTEEISSDIIGKGIIEKNIKNSQIINELDIPITLLGIDNAIVAASPDGILVTNRDSSPKIKNYVEENNFMPMYKEKRWGWYKVLEFNNSNEDEQTLVKRIYMKKNKNYSYKVHHNCSQVWTLLKGEAEVITDGYLRHAEAGDVIQIPKNVKHSIKALEELEFIEIQKGKNLGRKVSTFIQNE